MIVDDGYNIGQDLLVEKAVSGSHWKGVWWRVDLVWNGMTYWNPGEEVSEPFSSELRKQRCRSVETL